MGPLSDVCDALVAVISVEDADAAAVETFLGELRPLVKAALARALEEREEHFAAIRRFYLEPKPAYSCEELASLWRIDVETVCDVFHDELTGCARSSTVAGSVAAETTVAYGLLRAYDVERALGGDFLRVRGAEWKTIPVILHLPRFVADAFAPQNGDGLDLARAASIEQFLFEFYAREYGRGHRRPEVSR